MREAAYSRSKFRATFVRSGKSRIQARANLASFRSHAKENNMFKKGKGLQAFAALLSVFLLFTGNLTALAQSSGTIQGTVTDPSGAAVVGAKVVVRNEATGEERTTQTDSAGAYQVAALPVGNYQIQVQAQGFQTHMVK